MRRLVIFAVAAILGVANGAQGAQVYTPPSISIGHLTGIATGITAGRTSSWSANALYVRDGTGRSRVALRADKDVSQLDIADIAGKQGEFALVNVVRLGSLGDPLIGDSLGKLTFATPPSPGPRKQLMAIAWLFAIGLIGIATVGRRKKL